jgi:hypothetical protein
MTLAGWIFMLGSISAVVGLVVFCFYRVLTKPSTTEHLHAPLDIDTRDLQT